MNIKKFLAIGVISTFSLFLFLSSATAISVEKVKNNFKSIIHEKPVDPNFFISPVSDRHIIYHMPNFSKFLVSGEQGFIKIETKTTEWGTIKKYYPTEKLQPYIIRKKLYDSDIAIQIARYILKSIDKVERYKYDDDDVFKIYFTYYVDPIFLGLPSYGPFKGYGTAHYQLWKKEEDPKPIAQYLHQFKWDSEFFMVYDEWIGKNFHKLLDK